MRLGNPKLAVDAAAEDAGVWNDCPTIWWVAEDKPARIRVRSRMSRRYQALLRKLTKGLDKDDLEEKAEDIAVELTAILTADWQGIVDEAGNDVPYSEETALAIMRNRENRDFVNFVNLCADNTQQFYFDKRGSAEKN